MAKFRYRMQNILEIKEKMEEQEKVALRYRQCKAVGGTGKTTTTYLSVKAGYEAQIKRTELVQSLTS